MPFLRFSRDKRGYENTFVMHTFRRRGRSESRILYWFRTPPAVRVGRSALDEDAIRTIEENNPDLEFEWSKMLRVQTSAASMAARETAERRRERGGRPAPGRPKPRPAPPEKEPAALESVAPALEAARNETPVAVAIDAVVENPPADDLPELPDDAAEDARPDTPLSNPVAVLVGEEGLARLRARHAELLARITERVSDPVRREELRNGAEALNPDTWVTAEEARLGIEECERRHEEWRELLGRRRRRSRRGGRRRRGRRGAPGGGPGSGPTQSPPGGNGPPSDRGPDTRGGGGEG